MTGIFSQQQLLTNALSVLTQNHEVLSQNIANINTPGFKTREIRFEEFMRRVENGDADRLELESLAVNLKQGLRIRKDGNNVNLDAQLGQMKQNSLLYQTFSHLLASKMATTRQAISR